MVIEFLKGRFPRAVRTEDSRIEDESQELPEGKLGDSSNVAGMPVVIGRNRHTISRQLIDPDALKVLYRLYRAGFKAYLVGGGVRDLLLGKTPKDFDVGTDARPEQVRKLFRNSRIIGRRFRINHVYFPGPKAIEVTTFRGLADPGDDVTEVAPMTSDNVYGDAESDALRRDLTINGLFYDVSNFSVIDYVGGVTDLQNGIIRIIGNPEVRFREDPVRMIRAIRHAARTGFRFDPATYQAIIKCANLISLSSPARVYEELQRELRGGALRQSFCYLYQTGLLQYLIPTLEESIQKFRPASLPQEESSGAVISDRDTSPGWLMLEQTLRAMDDRADETAARDPGVLIAALYLGHYRPATEPHNADGPPLAHYFMISPPLEDTDHSNRESPRATPLLPSAGSRSRHRRTKTKIVAKTQLRSLINDLFPILNVPRKHRDSMECALIARYLMFVGLNERELVPQLRRHPHWKDALYLLRVTAHDDRAKECLSFWEKIGTEEFADYQRSRSSRGRRRRRRGRR